MQYTLKDYQADAVADVIDRLDTARALYRAPRPKPTSFALTATTGAGKTVMAAAVIESLFYGNDELDVEPDPTAVVLWFSDDPNLNEQTRHRLMAASDKLMWDDLVSIEAPFSYEKLTPGKVYFLNTSKLAKGTLLTRGHTEDDEDQIPELRNSAATDLQGHTIWETIANTINDPDRTLLMVLDEAHRGFGRRTSEDKPTIVRRLINGHAGIPPMPVVWGISATVERFETAMSDAGVTEANRLPLPKVLVDPIRVQASGLLKDTVRLDIPAEAGTFDTVLLERATEKVIASTHAWAEYAATQATETAGAGTAEDPVLPLMVLQLPNRPDPEDVARALDTIFAKWPALRADQVAHVLGDHTTQQYGPFEVRYIAPERVQDDTSVRVLLAKDGISTGWDCPRAEVLVSFRPAKDATHITQLLGRMVRTPLARRIPGNDQLNAVECILPFFDKRTAKNVVRVITGSLEDFPDSGDGGRRVLINPQLMLPNPAIDEAVWEAFESLPSQSLPRKNARPVKRLTALAHLLAHDGLLPNAGAAAHRYLHGVLDGLRARYADDLARAVEEIHTVRGATIIGAAGQDIQEDSFTAVADDRAIRDAFRQAGRVIAPAVAGTYVDHVTGDGDDDDLRDAHVAVAALATLPATGPELDRAADDLANQWFDAYRVAIKDLPDERQAVYNDIRSLSTDPQRMTLTRPKNSLEETMEESEVEGGDPRPMPTADRHLLADEDGRFPIGQLNSPERLVLAQEMARPGAVAWYRNPPRASQDSLGIAYPDKRGDWRTLRPDFVFFDRPAPDGPVRASLVDPHGHWLPDALPKLRGLAAFAAEYGTEFHRIEAVSEVGDQPRVLDMQDERVRAAVEVAEDAETLYAGPHAQNY